jgi:Rieske Fe-S protein
MSSEADVRWKQDFPIPSEEDSYVTRREFTKFLGLTSLAFFLGTFTAAARKLWKRAAAGPPVSVAQVNEIAVGGYKLFRYPTENDPCILLRLEQDKFVAFNQNCTHLACPVHFNAATGQLVCPCHKGFFSADNGRPLAGPPRRPLAALAISIRGDQVWAELSQEEPA